MNLLNEDNIFDCGNQGFFLNWNMDSAWIEIVAFVVIALAGGWLWMWLRDRFWNRRR